MGRGGEGRRGGTGAAPFRLGAPTPLTLHPTLLTLLSTPGGEGRRGTAGETSLLTTHGSLGGIQKSFFRGKMVFKSLFERKTAPRMDQDARPRRRALRGPSTPTRLCAGVCGLGRARSAAWLYSLVMSSEEGGEGAGGGQAVSPPYSSTRITNHETRITNHETL